MGSQWATLQHRGEAVIVHGGLLWEEGKTSTSSSLDDDGGQGDRGGPVDTTVQFLNTGSAPVLVEVPVCRGGTRAK